MEVLLQKEDKKVKMIVLIGKICKILVQIKMIKAVGINGLILNLHARQTTNNVGWIH